MGNIIRYKVVNEISTKTFFCSFLKHKLSELVYRVYFQFLCRDSPKT